MAHNPGRPDRSLREILAARTYRRPMIVLDALPLSGTTRLMIDAIREVDPDVAIIDRTPADLVAMAYAKAFDDLSPYQTYAVWLDDLCPGNLLLLDADVLDIITMHAVILASMNRSWFRRITADTSRVAATARTVLTTYAHHLTMPFEMNSEERRRAQAEFPHVRINANLAEALVGGSVLLGRYHRGRYGCPHGHALVSLAVDARRAGVHRGLSEEELAELFQRSGTLGARSPQAFTEAMEWATLVPNDAASALLHPDRKGGWTALPYLAAAEDGNYSHPTREIAPRTWLTMISALPSTDSFHVGAGAHFYGLQEIAGAAFLRARKSPDPVIAARAVAVTGS
jgi:hypothetical protein